MQNTVLHTTKNTKKVNQFGEKKKKSKINLKKSKKSLH